MISYVLKRQERQKDTDIMDTDAGYQTTIVFYIWIVSSRIATP